MRIQTFTPSQIQQYRADAPAANAATQAGGASSPKRPPAIRAAPSPPRAQAEGQSHKAQPRSPGGVSLSTSDDGLSHLEDHPDWGRSPSPARSVQGSLPPGTPPRRVEWDDWKQQEPPQGPGTQNRDKGKGGKGKGKGRGQKGETGKGWG